MTSEKNSGVKDESKSSRKFQTKKNLR